MIPDQRVEAFGLGFSVPGDWTPAGEGPALVITMQAPEATCFLAAFRFRTPFVGPLGLMSAVGLVRTQHLEAGGFLSEERITEQGRGVLSADLEFGLLEVGLTALSLTGGYIGVLEVAGTGDIERFKRDILGSVAPLDSGAPA